MIWNKHILMAEKEFFCIVHTMSADVLVTLGARASEAMLLTKLFWNIQSVASYMLIDNSVHKYSKEVCCCLMYTINFMDYLC